MATENTNPEDIFHKAIEIADDLQCQVYLDEACGDNTELRREVEALLQAHQQAGDFLESPPVDPNVTLDTAPPAVEPGMLVGRYKLLERIGEGGMAVVYMAEQKQPIRRRVALKIIKLGMDTQQVIARFEAERQALAMMDHPNVAKVLDAGATDAGRPYFVMELVRGVSITDYCDKNKLSTKQRLELFIPVCKAVQHAHHKGIIHRDLKPSNIMVTLHDGQPVPMVIDFGVAKATNQELTEKTLFTRYAQMIGTPEYMSPEQAEMSGLDIDVRTDIYSLGVLLYELLTGVTPFGGEQLRQAGYAEIQRIIRETEPQRPSTRLSTLGETLTDVAQQRRTSAEMLPRLVRGDLDWIVMKTLEKDRTHRYETAHALAEDIERYLRDEPTAAGRPGVLTRSRKFVRRHRALVAGTVAVLAVLVAGIVVSTLFALGQARARAEAERARADAELHAGTKADMMMYVQMGMVAQGVDATVGEVLDTMSKNMDMAQGMPVLSHATFRQFAGNMYVGLGLYEEAEPHLEKAVELFQEELGPQHTSTIAARGDLAYLRSKQQNPEQALEILREGMPADSFTPEAALRGPGIATIGLVETYMAEEKYDEAIAVLQHAINLAIRIVGDEHVFTLEAKFGLANVYERQGRYEKAQAQYEEILGASRRTLGQEHMFTLEIMRVLAGLYGRQDRYVEAQAQFEEVLAVSRRTLGEKHGLTALIMYDFGKLCQNADKRDRAIQLFTTVIAIPCSVHGELCPEILDATLRLAQLRGDKVQYDEAEHVFLKALEMARHKLGEEHLDTLRIMDKLAALYRDQKRFEKAKQYCAEALKMRRRVLGQKHRGTLQNLSRLGSLYVNEGRSEEAKPHFERLVELDPNYARYSNLLAVVQSYTGDLEGYRKTCRLMLDHFSGSEHLKYANQVAWTCSLAPGAVEDFGRVVRLAERGLGTSDTIDRLYSYPGVVLHRAGRFEEAIERLEEYVSICEEEDRSLGRPSFAYTCFFLAMANHQSGQHEQATTWFAKAVEQADQERADRPYWWWVRRLTLELFETEARQLLGVPEQ